jgi:competence protein ComEA
MDEGPTRPRHSLGGDGGAAHALESLLTPAPPPRRLAVGAALLAAAVAVGWWLLRPADPPLEVTLPRAGTGVELTSTTVSSGSAPGSTTTNPSGAVVVHVAGAVAAPGVVTLVGGVRVADAVAAAGGLRPDADVDRVNLAAPLEDGSRVYVPVLGEEAEPSVVPPEPPPGAGPAGTSGTGPVDINRATEADLDALPGIGPSTASAIVAHREANGPFRSVEQLEEVRGIGPAKLEQLRPLVVVGR